MRFPPIHTLLFALYPILFLWSSNVGSVRPEEVPIPLIVSAGVALALLLVLRICLRWDMRRIGIWVSFFLCMFFSYWIFEAVASFAVYGNGKIVPNFYFFPFWCLILILGTIWIARTHRNLDRLTAALNVMAGFLVAISVLGIVFASTGKRDRAFAVSEAQLNGIEHGSKQMKLTALKKQGALPDIYYIILDAYGRSDVLKDLYEYDNSPFLDWLSEKGFYVARESRANYCQTSLSLASSLNGCFLDHLVPAATSRREGNQLLTQMIRTNRVSRALRDLGYKTVAFSSGYSPTELKGADFYVAPPWNISEFLDDLMGMLPVHAAYHLLLDRYGLGNDFHRQRVSFSLDNLASVTKEKGPFFVFCHIVAPHPPFLFDEKGQPVEPDIAFSFDDASHYHRMLGSLQKEYRDGYIKQLRFINQKMMVAIEKIVSNSTKSSIIIIQGDHGPGSLLDWSVPEPITSALQERMPILNALRVPAEIRKFLYPGMTPVNSFRTIFNRYFGQPLEVLPDKSYFSLPTDPFKLIDVTDTVR